MNNHNETDRNVAIENFEPHKNVPDTSSATSKDGVPNYRMTEPQNAQKNEEQLPSKDECINHSQPIDTPQKIITLTPEQYPSCTKIVEARPTSDLCKTRKRRTRGRRKSKVSRKQGGWPITSGIPHRDFSHLRHSVGMLERIGLPLRHFISIRPPAEILSHAARKKYCRDKVDSLRRRFNRKQQPFVGIGIFELEPGGLLHLHVAIHTTSRLVKLLENMENTDVFHIRRYDSKGLGYLLKSRLPTHPDRERELFKSFPRRKNEKIRGKRWFWTKDAKAFLPNEGKPPSSVRDSRKQR